VGPINSSKNKLNSKISWLFKLEPNTDVRLDADEKLKLFHYLAYFYYYL